MRNAYFGVCTNTGEGSSLLGQGSDTWSLRDEGTTYHNSSSRQYGTKHFEEGDVIEVILDKE